MLNFLLSWLTENELRRFRGNEIQKFPFCSIVLNAFVSYVFIKLLIDTTVEPLLTDTPIKRTPI